MSPDQTTVAPSGDVGDAPMAESLGIANRERWLTWARDAHSTSTTYFESSVRARIIDDIKQANSIHKTGSKYHKDEWKTRSRLFRPKTRSTIRKNKASAAEALFSTRDLLEVTAEDDGDPLNVAASVFVKELLQYRLKKSMPWFQTVIGAYEDAQITGVVCSFQDWEYNKARRIDRPCCKLIPLENLRIDPACDWTDPIGSSPYVIHEIPMYVKDVKARARGTDPHKAPWFPVTEAQMLAAAGRSIDPVRAVRESKQQDSKGQSSAITDFTIVWVHRNIVQVDGQDWVYYTLGTTTLLSDPQPIEKVYWHGKRPYVMGTFEIEAHRNYPGGIPAMTADLQAEMNELVNMRQDNVKFALQKRHFVKRNGQIDLRSLMRNIPGSATLMNDPEKDVKVVDTPDVTASSYKEQDLLNVDFDDMAGTFNQGTVQTNRNLNETVGGIELLDDKANQVGNYQLKVFVITWMLPVMRQLAELEAHYESDATILTLCAKACKLNVPAEQGGLGISDINNELMMQDLIINIDAGQSATNPTARMAILTGAMGTIRSNLSDGVLEGHGLKTMDFISEVMSVAGYRDAEKFFSAEVDPAVAALQKQVADLQAQLKGKQDDPQLVAAKIATENSIKLLNEAKALQSNLTAAFEAMQGAGIAVTNPVIAKVADAMMKAGGYQAPMPAGDDPHYESGMGAAGVAAMPQDENGPIPQLPALAPGATPLPPSGNTDPLHPALPAGPASGAVGAQAGIETPRNEGA